MMRLCLLATIGLTWSGQAAPPCDDPKVHRALLQAWDRMANAKGDTLAHSRVKLWNLRQDGNPGECRVDFLARKPGASLGGSLPFAVNSTPAGHILVRPRGELTVNLLQADTARAP